jgi:hypothetical protein
MTFGLRFRETATCGSRDALGVLRLLRFVFGGFPDLYLVDPGPGVRIDVNRTLNLRSVLLAFSLVILIFRLDAFSVWIHTHRSEVVQKAALWNERDDQIRKR